MQKRIIMTDEEKEFLSSSQNIGNEITINGALYTLESVISKEGFKSIIWKGLNTFNYPVVIKFATYLDYEERPFIAEINKASKLYEYPQFAQYYGAEIKTFNEGKIKCVVFVERYVKGTDLFDYKEVTVSFIINYIKNLCEILNILKENNLRHDDLHSRNVIIVPPKKGLIENSQSLVVIDMGSLKDYTDELKPIKKGFDDLKNFCVHIKELNNKLLFNKEGQKKPLRIFERKFRNEVEKILDLILEEDEQRALQDPIKIYQEFLSAYNRCRINNIEEKIELHDPFDYISAEHISNDRLLIKLFAQSCPWLNEIKNPNPILLTGPRGCGKSMIFRWLSLRSLLLQSDDEIVNSEIAGFYVSCSAELRNRFSLFGNDLQAEYAKEEIIHYFNLLLCREVIFTLIQMSAHPKCFEIFNFSEKEENEIYNYLTEQLNIEASRRLHLQGVKPLEHLYEIIIYEMNLCYEYLLKRNKLTSYASLTFLSDFTKFLKEKIGYFKLRTVTFLLDDYSIHRISQSVQKILKPIIWDRQPSHIFKVSAEKYGMVHFTDSEYTREYDEVDIGFYYINFSDLKRNTELKQFAKDLLNQRLILSGYNSDADKLIGESEYEDGSLALAIRAGRKNIYYGLDTITKTCSGDISALLEIYRNIFKIGEIKKDSDTLVSQYIQHEAIQSVSRKFLSLIKTYQPYGYDMYNVVVSFGNMCKKIIEEGKMQKIEGHEEPNETTRIEVEELEKSETWNSDQRNKMDELIRRSIFISLEPGRGRHTGGTTIRWQLRRIYCPALKCGLLKNNAIKWSDNFFKYFLFNPRETCEMEFKKWKKNGKSNENIDETNTLFNNSNE